MIFSREHTYTTRSWVSGIGANKGFRVVTNAVNGVAAGQELWFSNASLRMQDGTTNTGSASPSNGGYYWASDTNSSKANFFQYGSSAPYGRPRNDRSKLEANAIRCVRLIGLYE